MQLYTHLRLHLVVVILGFTAILGKLISIQAIDLVFFRTLIAVISGAIFLMIVRRKMHINLKKGLTFFSVGFIVGVHWITFFHAIKVSNVSVTLACLPISTLFTAFAEPISQKRKVSRFEVLLAGIIFLGLILIFGFETEYKEGIFFSMISFILAGVFSVMNKNISKDADPQGVNLIEMFGACVCVLLFSLFSNGFAVFTTSLKMDDILWLLLLGTICTTFAFAEVVALMKKLSAYSVVLAINLEPVYGIILARIMFGESEKMSFGFYVGTLIVTLAVFSYPLLKRLIR